MFGKERSGRVRGYGRGVTKTSLKIDAEIDVINRKHSEEMSSLKYEMDNKMDNMQMQMAGLQNVLKVLFQKVSPGVDLGDLAPFLSSPSDANSAPNMDKNGVPQSSTSTHLPDPNC